MKVRGTLAVYLIAVLIAEPVLSSEFLLEEQQLLASDGLNSDQFGTAVAIDGNFAVVGANGVDRDTNLEGAAYVYRLTPSGWIEDAVLQASDIAEGDQFGYAVDISGSRIIVGSPYNDDFGFNTGAAYIFERAGGQWVEQQRIVAADRSDFDQFGQSVAIDGETVLIGSPRDDDLGNDSGSVYVFARADGWQVTQPPGWPILCGPRKPVIYQ